MAGRRSAGVLVHRVRDGVVEVLIAHMGGPFWAAKEDAAWSLPKGEYDDGEDPRAAAWREFAEEVCLPVPAGDVIDLGELRQPSGKLVTAWAVEGDLEPPADLVAAGGSTFELEWPPRSGTIRSYPEVDRVAWFSVAIARRKLVKGQVPFLDRLIEHLHDTTPDLPTPDA